MGVSAAAWMCRVARRACRCGGLKSWFRLAGREQQGVGESYERNLRCLRAGPRDGLCLLCDPGPSPVRHEVAWNATPGWARPPAEFKHINKRRKRNLRGFP